MFRRFPALLVLSVAACVANTTAQLCCHSAVPASGVPGLASALNDAVDTVSGLVGIGCVPSLSGVSCQVFCNAPAVSVPKLGDVCPVVFVNL